MTTNVTDSLEIYSSVLGTWLSNRKIFSTPGPYTKLFKHLFFIQHIFIIIFLHYYKNLIKQLSRYLHIFKYILFRANIKITFTKVKIVYPFKKKSKHALDVTFNMLAILTDVEISSQNLKKKLNSSGYFPTQD